MYYKEISKIKELVDEYQWNNDNSLVIVSYYNLQEFVELIKDNFEYGYVENSVVYLDCSIGFDIFQDILEYYDVDAKEVFPEEY